MIRRVVPAAVLALLLVTTGCATLGPNDDGGGPSAADFPNESDIGASTMDGHAAVLANASFTVAFEQDVYKYNPHASMWAENTWNGTRRASVDPVDHRYLLESSGTWPYLGQLANGTVYADGSTQYLRDEDENGSVTVSDPRYAFDESGEAYLWSGWREGFYVTPYQFVSENVSFERAGTEQFHGTTVMRYEVSGVDAHPDAEEWATYENATIDEFSVTLLLDADGVIRRYRVDYGRTLNGKVMRSTFVHTVTDVGSTDVERPDWATNESATAAA